MVLAFEAAQAYIKSKSQTCITSLISPEDSSSPTPTVPGRPDMATSLRLSARLLVTSEARI